MRPWILLPLLMIFCGITKLPAQVVDSLITNGIRISDISNYENIVNYSRFYISAGIIPTDLISNLPYEDSLPAELRRGFAVNIVDRNIYVRFNIHNTSDSVAKIYFFPGVHFDEIELYKNLPNGEITRIKAEKPAFSDSAGYRLISLELGELSTFYARIKPVRVHTNSFRPHLIRAEHIVLWRTHFRNLDNNSRVFSFVISGMLLMMIFYAIINYFQTLQKQFLYYSLYACGLALLFFLYALHNRASTSFNYFLESYLDLTLQLTAHFFHFLFIQHFLGTATNFRRLHILLRCSQIVVLSCLLIFSYLYFSGGSFVALNYLENGCKYFLLGFGLLIVFTGLVRSDRLLKFLMLGYVFLILMSTVSLLMAVFHWQPFAAGSLLNRSLVLYETGIVIELIFFLAGLSYKNRKELITRTAEREKLKLENERKEFEKQIAILQAQQEERNRISVDMHDELGGGMTAIRLMSELAMNKSKQNPIPELEKISASANDLLVKMNAIIWSMSQSNDSLANLLAYIRAYSLEYFENTSIECTVDVPMEIPAQEMSGEKRRNTFLTVKETLNNTLKHSKASLVNIQISLNGTLQISIHDNGKGIQLEKMGPFGNGLRNMKKRIESIGGTYRISSERGTLTFLDIPL